MKFIRVGCLIVFVLGGLSGHLAAQQSSAPDPALTAQIEQGKKALQEGKYKEALDLLKSANKQQHDACGQCNFLLAIVYFHLRDQGHALESCDKAIKTADSNGLRAAAHNLKGNLLLASAGDDRKKMQAAEAEFQSAVQLDPKAPVFHLNLAKALLRESQDDAAKKELQLCLDCGPDPKLKEEAEKMMANPKLGRSELAPDFELTTMQGQQLSLKTLAGRVVVMDFWATWCPPCRESVPELKELTRKYPSEKLVLISVSADEKDDQWRDFVAKKKMDWAQYRDGDGKIREAFGVHSFPTYMVIDGDGVIRERMTGLNPQESVVHRLKATLGAMPQLEGEARK
jgi:thiol-disulfide isomerase/thioredoxin/Tfp pilus assembly protein PilF